MTDSLNDGILGVDVDLLSDMEIIAMGGEDAVEVLTGLMTVPIIDVVSDIDVDILTDDENVSGLAAVMPPLDFTLSAPREESIPLC